jgi:tetratricopeptide (TPR) repeat protein
MRLRHALFTLSLVCAVSSSAYAEDDPRRAEADLYFQEGLKLHDAAKEEAALEKFNKAYAIYPSPNGLFQIARSEHLLARYLPAIRHYREALKSPLLHPKNQDLAKKNIAELERILARVEIVGLAGTRVTVGDATFMLPLSEPLDVEPGTVLVSGANGDARFEGRATALTAKTTRLELVPIGRTVPPSGEHVEPPPVTPSPTFWTTGHTIGVVGWALGAGAGVAGVVFTSNANDAADRLSSLRAKSNDPDRACSGVSSPDCDARRTADEDRARNTNLAIASFVASGVLVAGATAIFFAWPDGSRAADRRGAPKLVPIFDRHARGVALSTEF